MKLSQNSLFKADTYVRRVAESGILGLVHGGIRLWHMETLTVIRAKPYYGKYVGIQSSKRK